MVEKVSLVLMLFFGVSQKGSRERCLPDFLKRRKRKETEENNKRKKSEPEKESQKGKE